MTGIFGMPKPGSAAIRWGRPATRRRSPPPGAPWEGVPMLNWAILGLGKIAETRVAPAFRTLADNRLLAAAGRDADRTAAFAARHSIRPATVAEVLADPAIDAV